MPLENPFTIAREARNRTLTVRLTETEHGTLKKLAEDEDVEIGELVREGLGLLVNNRIAARQKARR